MFVVMPKQESQAVIADIENVRLSSTRQSRRRFLIYRLGQDVDKRKEGKIDIDIFTG